jgi:hypothetical protein
MIGQDNPNSGHFWVRVVPSNSRLARGIATPGWFRGRAELALTVFASVRYCFDYKSSATKEGRV